MKTRLDKLKKVFDKWFFGNQSPSEPTPQVFRSVTPSGSPFKVTVVPRNVSFDELFNGDNWNLFLAGKMT